MGHSEHDPGTRGRRPRNAGLLVGAKRALKDHKIEQITVYPWPSGGVHAQQVRGGYTLLSARTDGPVACLTPFPLEDFVEILWWRRDAAGEARPFDDALPLGEALAFVAANPAFWIRS